MTSNLRVHGSFQREPHRGRKLAAKKKEQAITCVCSLHLADLVDQYLQSSFGWSLCQCLQSSFGWSSCQCLYKRITFWLWIRAPWGAAVLVCSVPVKAVVCSVPVKAVVCSLPVKAAVKLQALVYDILPSTTAVFGYAIESRKLSAKARS